MTQISLSPFANFNSAVPWGLWVVIYVWLVGISVGSFVLAMWGNLKVSQNIKALTKIGTILSISTLAAGLLSIQIDLGHIERFPNLFLSPNFNSVMAWMAWLYTIYFGVLLLSLLWLKKELPKLFCGFAVILAMVALISESLLFSRPPGKIWHSLFFQLHFITSSFVSASGALIILTSILKKAQVKDQLLLLLRKIALPFVTLNIIFEVIELVNHSSLFTREGLILTWLNIMVIAFLLKKTPAGTIKFGYLALIQVLLSKYHAIISAQLVQPYPGFAQAYIEPKLGYNYFPSGFEIVIGGGLLLMVSAVFYFLYKIFPLTREG
jgi:molybdopterin-containing oxidoreductase family membrane subunit